MPPAKAARIYHSRLPAGRFVAAAAFAGAAAEGAAGAVDGGALDEVERRLGYPMIVKESYGSLGAGVFKDYASAAEKLVKVSGRVEPRKEYGPVYERKYQTYRKIVEALSGVWEELQEGGADV